MQKQWQRTELNIHAKAMKRIERSCKGNELNVHERQRQGAKIFGDGSLSTVMLLYCPKCSQKAKPEHSQIKKCLNKVPIKLQKVNLCLGHLNVSIQSCEPIPEIDFFWASARI